MKIRPLHDRVLVERLEEKEVRKGGIIIRTRRRKSRRKAR
jgi:co-chaperonin GroES (HSP10)